MPALNTADFEHFIRDVPIDLQQDWEQLSLQEKELVMLALRDSKVGQALHEVDFKQTPVGPEEFLSEPYYIGKDLVWNESEEQGIYPQWKTELCYVLDPANEIVEWNLSGAIGGGKTTVSIVALLYKIYWMSCLRNPHAYVGLAPTVPIDFVLFNINLRASSDAGLNRFETIINGSPYFRENFPASRRRRRKGYGGTSLDDYKLELPPYLRVLEASRETHSISRDVIGGMLDEVNFVPQAKGTGSLNYDSSSKAFALYQSIQNRIISRFLRDGKVSGALVCLCSSAATQYDFLEQHKKAQRRAIEEARAKGEKPHVHITEFAIYDLIPWRFKGPRFPVLLGTEQENSRILSTAEEGDRAQKEGKNVLYIPEVFRARYEADLPRALKEFSGVPSEVVSPLFPIREQVRETIDTSRQAPFTQESPQIGHRTGPPMESYLIPDRLAVWSGPSLAPRYYPRSARVIHVDLSKTQCATGISMGCVSGYKEIPNFSFPKLPSLGGFPETTTIAPIIWMDFTLRIAPPPPPEEVGYEKIHAFINYLKNKLGYNIVMVSFDGYQSTMFRQILQNEGYTSEELSMDKTPGPYFALRGAVLDNRLVRYAYPPLEKELYALRLLSERNKVWVEKPAGGEKDTADTVAGVCWWCTEMPRDILAPFGPQPSSTVPLPYVRA